MLAIIVLTIVSRVLRSMAIPVIRVVSSGRTPILELPASCSFHGFASHAWGTGQDQTHTMVRKLQLLVPNMKVWLDVDNLEDVGKLEAAVGDSAVFVIFLSAGYFRSANCRRELYTALKWGKPIVAVREADTNKGGATVEELKEECRQSCVETASATYPEFRGSSEVIERVFAVEPIVWVRVNDFQVQSLKLITLRILQHLSYYKDNPDQLVGGLKVP
eukprot:3938473-Rhodomonas_salina.1